jgi:hypothetical protein
MGELIFEVLAEIFAFLFQSVVQSLFVGLVLIPIGFCYMYLRYRRSRLVRRVLRQEYEGRYHNVGQVVVLNLVAGIGILLVLALLIGAPVAHWVQQLRH